MISYVTAFIFYTLAMIGIMFAGFIVYKKTFENSKGDNKGLIRVIDSTPIGNKKMLLVVKIRNEQFLIASGVEHTTFLSKLENNIHDITSKNQEEEIKEEIEKSVIDEIYQENSIQTQLNTRMKYCNVALENITDPTSRIPVDAKNKMKKSIEYFRNHNNAEYLASAEVSNLIEELHRESAGEGDNSSN